MNMILYFGLVFGVMLVIVTGLALLARTTKWKPKPIRPVWAALLVFTAVFVAGTICSLAAHDIHVLYWWLAGIPALAVGLTFCALLLFLFRTIYVLTLICFQWLTNQGKDK